jgi:FAD/FMN-containing dehydrogenase
MAAAFLDAARTICGGNEYAVDGAAIEPRYLEPARYAPGRAAALLRPATTEQIAALVKLAATHGLTIVPQGAHTGLVRAATPTDAQRHVLLATDRLRGRFEFDPLDRTLVVSAGYKLSEINARLEPHGLFFPIDLSADPSVGGMLAHNTGGTRMLRYGDVRANTLALTAVLADGEIVHAGRGLQKDNAGLALQHLFIGSSGSLGVITEATLKLHPLPRQRAATLVAPSSLDDVFPLYQRVMQSELAGLVSAFEGISKPALEAAQQHRSRHGNVRPLFDGAAPEYALLIELSSELSPARLDLEALLQQLLEQEFETGRVADAVIGADHDVWEARHSISEGLREHGKVIGFDISLPRKHFMRFRAEGAAWLAEHFPQARVADFGHLGDGGLHFNMVWPHDAPALDAAAMERLRAGVNEIVVRLGGSFSAEHGVGPQIQQAYWQLSDAGSLALSGRIEHAMNPDGVLGLTRFGPAA